MKIVVKPRSDQWNADDFIGGPRTFTIAGAKNGAAEAPYDIELAEGEGRVWRPPNGMLSALLQLWGDEAVQWIGRRVTLFNDPSVKFGKETPGGIRISHMSDIGPKPVTVRITVSRGRKGPYTVKPLIEATPAPAVDWDAEIAATNGDLDLLRGLYTRASSAGATTDTLNQIKAAAATAAPKENN